MFTIRRMTPADKPAMLDISSRIWEGRDYIPRVFDQWVSDTEGEFAAVLRGGSLVGCGKLTFLTPVDAWLEGLRKDPLLEDRGVTEAVARHFLAVLARRPALSSVRFATGAGNAASIGANEKLGFQRRTVLSRKTWKGAWAEISSATLTDPSRARSLVRRVDDASAAHAFVDRAGCFSSATGLMVEGWKAFPYSPALLAERYVARGLCRGIAERGELRALSIAVGEDLPPGTQVRLVCLDAADDADLHLMMDDVILTAAAASVRAGADRGEIQWMVPRSPRLLRLAADRGFMSDEREDDVLVYELPLELLAGVADPG